MKRIITFALLGLFSLLMLSGCGSSRYVVVTSDYSIHVAKTKPELDPSTNTLTFEDEQGNEISIPQGDLKQSRKLR